MPTKSELMREQAARLLSLSTQAREAGNGELAELLTEAAANCLANIVGAELDEAPPQATPPTQQPVAQQQQQVQPPKEDDEQGS